jgi:hypothetical protein
LIKKETILPLHPFAFVAARWRKYGSRNEMQLPISANVWPSFAVNQCVADLLQYAANEQHNRIRVAAKCGGGVALRRKAVAKWYHRASGYRE